MAILVLKKLITHSIPEHQVIFAKRTPARLRSYLRDPIRALAYVHINKFTLGRLVRLGSAVASVLSLSFVILFSTIAMLTKTRLSIHVNAISRVQYRYGTNKARANKWCRYIYRE